MEIAVTGEADSLLPLLLRFYSWEAQRRSSTSTSPEPNIVDTAALRTRFDGLRQVKQVINTRLEKVHDHHHMVGTAKHFNLESSL